MEFIKGLFASEEETTATPTNNKSSTLEQKMNTPAPMMGGKRKTKATRKSLRRKATRKSLRRKATRKSLRRKATRKSSKHGRKH